jgi:hypothetical protein
MAAKRQRANQAREALGKQVIPWNFGLPASACETGYGQAQTMVGQTRRKKTRKRTQIERTMEDGTVEQLQSNHRPKNTDLTWDEFLHHGYALPFSNRRIDPLNQQRSNRWTIGNIPAYIRSDGIFPKMRSNVMELICRSQQAPWWPHGIYTSVLTTLLITRKFGRVYPIFDSSHQYGLTVWYKLLMYCLYNDNHWSLVNIFMDGESWIVL